MGRRGAALSADVLSGDPPKGARLSFFDGPSFCDMGANEEQLDPEGLAYLRRLVAPLQGVEEDYRTLLADGVVGFTRARSEAIFHPDLRE